MKHRWLQMLPYCGDCGMLFQDWREFSAVCPGKPMDDVVPPDYLPAPTPLPHGASPAPKPGPRVMWAFNQALELLREHYDSPLPANVTEAVPQRAKAIRLTARSLCRQAGADPDRVVIVPGVLPRTPKGALVIDQYLLNAVPYWTLFTHDARIALEAAEAAKDGKELPHDSIVPGPAEAV